MLRAALPTVLAACAAALTAEDVPLSMLQLCAGKAAGKDKSQIETAAMQNIISWNNVPHDWEYVHATTKEERDNAPRKGDSNGRHQGKDWWYWGDDWKQLIANGDQGMSPEPSKEREWATTNKNFLGQCNEGANAEMIGQEMTKVLKLSDCRKACAFEFTTTTDIREKCHYFSYDDLGQKCRLYRRCGWPYDKSQNQNENQLDLTDEDCYGQETRSDDCKWTGTVWKTYTLVDIFPAGFRSYSLREFNEPPLCIHVPNSSDKKVEVMIETEMNDSRVCVTDGRDVGVFTNDVGNVRTCDNGQLYSCFTAATTNSGNGSDFFFYISCEGSCEASDVDLWIRMRMSDRNWEQGKKDWSEDIEYWCEEEKGKTCLDNKKVERNEFTYPSELLPDEPEKYPYRITQTFPDSAGALSTALACLAGLVAAYYVM